MEPTDPTILSGVQEQATAVIALAEQNITETINAVMAMIAAFAALRKKYRMRFRLAWRAITGDLDHLGSGE